MNAKARKNESRTVEIEINQTRNFQKKPKPLDIDSMWSWKFQIANYDVFLKIFVSLPALHV